MSDVVTTRLQNAEKMAFCGESLARSLYALPVTILCTGPLGSGKTTFLQGLARGLGVADVITSPTFALSQHYSARDGIPFIHMDLFRLSQQQAMELMQATDDHAGIRSIEWAERLSEDAVQGPVIRIDFREKGTERTAHFTFSDCTLPSRDEVDDWRARVHLPLHIVDHCEAVARCARRIAEHLIERSIVVRVTALTRAAELHDLFRFIDFRAGAGPTDIADAPEDQAVWKTWKERWENVRAGMRHEEACARFLSQHGYETLGQIVAVHGLRLPPAERSTIEQQILFYADKRVRNSTIVTLAERFEDFRRRYGDTRQAELGETWLAEAKNVEQMLFPDGLPDLSD